MCAQARTHELSMTGYALVESDARQHLRNLGNQKGSLATNNHLEHI
jgi:hypothetical protein